MVKRNKICCSVCGKEVNNKNIGSDSLLDDFQICNPCDRLLSINQSIDNMPFDDLGFV